MRRARQLAAYNAKGLQTSHKLDARAPHKPARIHRPHTHKKQGDPPQNLSATFLVDALSDCFVVIAHGVCISSRILLLQVSLLA